MRTTGFLVAIALLPVTCAAQTEGEVGLSRYAHAREVIKDSLPPPPAVVQERVVLPARAVLPLRVPLPARVVARPIVEERVVVAQPANAPAQSRFGYYDDSYFDDNWYYDYYASPVAAAPSGPAISRTEWAYAPTAEDGIFSW